VSGAVGLAHYAHRGGDTSPLKGQAARAFEAGKKAVQDTPLWERAKSVFRQLSPAPAASHGEPSAAATEADAAADQGDIRVYFAPCSPLNPLGIDHAFIRFLNRATRSIYGAFYDLELPRAADILIAKRRAGVDVRIVSDSDYTGRETVQRCIQAGIPVVFDARESAMHDKFCVVDGAYVWTGSTNITENCMYRNNNNSVLITSRKLAADFAAEFDEMFSAREFGKGSPRNTPYPEVMVGDTRIACCFAPEDHVQRKIVDAINAARTAIDFMAFSFTAQEIAEAMVARLGKGVRVRGLFDARESATEHSQDEFLARHGAAVYLDKNKYSMHNKVIVIDDAIVVTGSYNFTKNAETRNDENVLIIHAPAVARQYEREFESLLPRQVSP
jgi:phosphatidylserine/phosphatidylglycerophosphate/cardiolipin synthase-like enzyme